MEARKGLLLSYEGTYHHGWEGLVAGVRRRLVMMYSWSESGEVNAGAQLPFSRKPGSGKMDSGAQLPFSFFSAWA